MNLTYNEYLDSGTFADVWSATDDLGRPFAVKLFRPSGLGVSDALAHAKALVRAEHPSIVQVHSIETLPHPESGENRQAIVMELLDGVTLNDFYGEGEVQLIDLQRIGLALIDAVRHMHEIGVVHGDLHSHNVMVGPEHCKVIDILYLNSLAIQSTASRESRLNRDVLSLRLLLHELIANSELTPSEVLSFNQALDSTSSVGDIREAFLDTTGEGHKFNHQGELDTAYRRFIDPDYVKGNDYAIALSDSIADPTIDPLLIRVIEDVAFDRHHRPLVRMLWARSTAETQSAIALLLEARLSTELPEGTWWPHLRFLDSIGSTGWNLLSPVERIRIEGILANDILAGRKDIFETHLFAKGGQMATYVRSFFPYMSNIDTVSENLQGMLRQNWYTQNYVGEHFMPYLEDIARLSSTSKLMLDSLGTAISNDARVVMANLDKLPEDWQTVLRGAAGI